MTAGTLLRYLVGNRQAIIDIANCPSALGVGVLFVLSAGFAREYDGEDLRAEPWHLLIPIAASLATSFVLFLLTFFKLAIHDPQRPRFFTAYRAFLGLYWLTAPLAWLYAIPYERFLSAPHAVEANLWTLGLVAAWRVVLMIRVISVLLGYSAVHALILVLLFADSVALLAMEFVPLPIVSFMGGVRLSESDRVIQNVTCIIRCWGGLMMPVLIIFALIVFAGAKPVWQHAGVSVGAKPRASRSLWLLGVASVIVWTAVLPFTQPEQQLRHTVEQALRAGHLQEGLDIMLAHRREDFPPHWDPPPRIGYANQSPPLLDIAELIDEKSESWVRTVYGEKVRLVLDDRLPSYRVIHGTIQRVRLAARFGVKLNMDEDELESLLKSIDKISGATDAERAEAKSIVEGWLREKRRKQ